MIIKLNILFFFKKLKYFLIVNILQYAFDSII